MTAFNPWPFLALQSRRIVADLSASTQRACRRSDRPSEEREDGYSRQRNDRRDKHAVRPSEAPGSHQNDIAQGW